MKQDFWEAKTFCLLMARPFFFFSYVMTSRNKQNNPFEICVNQEAVILSDNIKK